VAQYAEAEPDQVLELLDVHRHELVVLLWDAELSDEPLLALALPDEGLVPRHGAELDA
tara:strand:- start:8187 stop:8360 length:174 start_codon:yes stop_codon:yes gene_type:complete